MPAAHETSGPPTEDPVAYDLYLKARLAMQALNFAAPVEAFQSIEGQLNEAIARDPEFGHAYALRAWINHWYYAFYNQDEARLKQAQADLASARRLLGDDPMVLAVDAVLTYSAGGYEAGPRALEIIEAADAAGLHDPVLATFHPLLLIQLGRFEDARAFYERMIALDPGNGFVLGNYGNLLSRMRQPAKALRVFGLPVFNTTFPGGVRLGQAEIIAAYTGRIEVLRAAFDKVAPALSPGTRLAQETELLLLEHRYAELERHALDNHASILFAHHTLARAGTCGRFARLGKASAGQPQRRRHGRPGGSGFRLDTQGNTRQPLARAVNGRPGLHDEG